jgi:hypothetical protein
VRFGLVLSKRKLSLGGTFSACNFAGFNLVLFNEHKKCLRKHSTLAKNAARRKLPSRTAAKGTFTSGVVESAKSASILFRPSKSDAPITIN